MGRRRKAGGSKGLARRQIGSTGEAGAPYRVLWHRDAEREYLSVGDVAERVAIQHAQEKLEILGPQLGAPHSSAVKAAVGSSLRELRPRAGRSRWRPLYKAVRADVFVIFAVAPEAQIDKRAFRDAVRKAQQRLCEVEIEDDAEPEGGRQ